MTRRQAVSERHDHHERTISAKVAVKMVIVKLANLFLLLTGAYLAGMSLLPATDSDVGVADAILYFVWGLILLTLIFLLSKLAHLPWFSALIPIALLSIKAIWRGQYRIQVPTPMCSLPWIVPTFFIRFTR